MSFSNAVRSGFTNYANFSGRAMRSEYWFWILFVVLANVATGMVDSMLGDGGTIGFVVGLALLVPNIAMAVRRLHDISKSAWNLLWGLIPVLGAIYLIYLYVKPSTPGENQYGPQPTGLTASSAVR